MVEETTQNNDTIKSITRKNGRVWTIKTNKDRFFYPKEWLAFYNNLSSREKFRVNDKYHPLTKQQLTCLLLLHTGARINEALHIKVEDIDLNNNRLVLKVTKTKARKGELVGKPRIIPISNKLRLILQRWIEQKKLMGNDYLGVLSTPATNIFMKKTAVLSGIKDKENFSAHTFRKTLEVWLMCLGIQDLKLLAHLGHDIKTAASAYVSPDIFTYEERMIIRDVLGDLYERKEHY